MPDSKSSGATNCRPKSGVACFRTNSLTRCPFAGLSGVRERFEKFSCPTVFVEVEGDPEVPIDLPLLREGCRADISLEVGEWVGRIGASIRSGYHLAIDYGYLEGGFFARQEGTLMCYRQHRAGENPYLAIGEQDITAHVNFSDLIEGGTRVGLEEVGYRTQMEFLIDLGLLELMEPLATRGDAASVKRLQALKNLLLPPMMGSDSRFCSSEKGLPPRYCPVWQKVGTDTLFCVFIRLAEEIRFAKKGVCPYFLCRKYRLFFRLNLR